jgi:dCMP deaminase
MASRLNIDEYYMRMLTLVASRSTCVRRAVGAIITDARGRVLSTGYNGVPSGVRHCIDMPCSGAGDQPGDSSKCLAVHAEQNALLQCTRPELAFKLYASCTPCFTCAKMIANTNIKCILVGELYADMRGASLFQEMGIKLHVFTKASEQMTSEELKSAGRLHYEYMRGEAQE